MMIDKILSADVFNEVMSRQDEIADPRSLNFELLVEETTTLLMTCISMSEKYLALQSAKYRHKYALEREEKTLKTRLAVNEEAVPLYGNAIQEQSNAMDIYDDYVNNRELTQQYLALLYAAKSAKFKLRADSTLSTKLLKELSKPMSNIIELEKIYFFGKQSTTSYDKEIERVSSFLAQDIERLASRFGMLTRALERVYGVRVSDLPNVFALATSGIPLLDDIDNQMRVVSDLLLKFSLIEHRRECTVRLSDHCDFDKLCAGINKICFEITPDLLNFLLFTRITGVSILADRSDGFSGIEARVQIPNDSAYLVAGDQLGTPRFNERVPLAATSALVFNSIPDYRNPRAFGEVSSTIVNYPPIGHWEVELRISDGVDLDDVKDVFVQVQYSGVPSTDYVRVTA